MTKTAKHKRHRLRRTINVLLWPILIVVCYLLGTGGSGVLWDVVGTVLLLLWIGTLVNHNESRQLASAPVGTIRVTTVKTNWVNQTVKKYAQYGWVLQSQSSAKSFGTAAKITMSFQKQPRQ